MHGTTLRSTFADDSSRYSVLVVDDDALIREQLASTLECAGYTVHAADSADQALQKLERSPCQLVVADREMPGMDGISLCRTVRQLGGPGYVYFMLLTVHGRGEDIIAGLEAGADDYVVKGTSVEELVARVNRGRRMLSQLAPAPASPRKDCASFALRLSWEYESCRKAGVPLSILLCAPERAADLRVRFGPEIGSELLASVRNQAQKLLLESDWIARSGPEGFAIVLPETGADGARLIAEKIHSMLTEAASNGTHQFGVRVSIGGGVAESRDEFRRFRAVNLLRAAERSLTMSRREGGDRVIVARLRDDVS